MATIEERIAALESKLKQEKIKKQQIEAQKLTKMLKGERSDVTRRKILAGALTLELMESDEATRQRFMGRLDKYLTRADDRALFGLPPIATPSPAPEKAPA